MTATNIKLVEFSDQQLAYLESCARIRQISVLRLLTRVLKAITDDQLVLPILDDDSKPCRKLPGEKTISKFHPSRKEKVLGAERGDAGVEPAHPVSV